MVANGLTRVWGENVGRSEGGWKVRGDSCGRGELSLRTRGDGSSSASSGTAKLEPSGAQWK